MPTYTGTSSDYLSSITPWPYTQERNRPWYEPYLLEQFARNSMWYNLIPFSIDMSGVGAETANFSQRLRPPADPTELDFRGLSVPKQYFDSRNFSVAYKSYGGGAMYHKYDRAIFQWARRNAGNPMITNSGIPQGELVPIIRDDVAMNMVETMDLVASRVFHTNAKSRIMANSRAGIYAITASDTFDPEIAKTVKLDADYGPYGSDGIFPVVTSPAAINTMVNLPTTTRYIDFLKANQSPKLLNYVAAEYMDMTFVKNFRMTLYNVGACLASASITVGLEPGDGAPAPTTLVDGFWSTGSDDAAHVIQLSAISDPGSAETGFKVGDIVTLCRAVAPSDGMMSSANSVIYNHAKNLDARVVAVDYSSNTISIEVPVLNENFSTALSVGMYGYVIKARPIHAAIFFKRGLTDPGVTGVVQIPPEFHIVPPTDDRMARWLFSWDTYMGYALIDPDAFDVYYFAGPIVRKSTTGGLEEINL